MKNNIEKQEEKVLNSKKQVSSLSDFLAPEVEFYKEFLTSLDIIDQHHTK